MNEPKSDRTFKKIVKQVQPKVDMSEKLRPRVNKKYNISPECKKEVNSSFCLKNQKKNKNQEKHEKFKQCVDFAADLQTDDFFNNNRESTLDSAQPVQSKKRRVA